MIFILDNYDSFTFNLYQYFGQLGEHIEVLRPDACTISHICTLQPELIVISPGPCSPNEAVLAMDVIKHFQGKVPILGICLGHQAIGQVFGAKVIRANTPVHGKVSKITHDETGVFHGVPNPLQVTRYHSLALQKDTIPDDFIISAVTEDGQVMGIRHRTLPIEGVQFHPEAILTEYGLQLLDSAIRDARRWIDQKWQQDHRNFNLNLENQKQNDCSNLTHIQNNIMIKTKELVKGFIPASRSEPTFDMNPGVVDSGRGVWQIRPLPDILARKGGEDVLSPHQLIDAFKEANQPFFLDSGSGYNTLGRYSYLGADPFLCISAYQDYYTICSNHQEKSMTYLSGENALTILDKFLTQYKVNESSSFPFCGGAVGFFSCDLKDEIENLPRIEKEENDLPLWRLAWYDGVIIYDHETLRYWLASCGMKDDGECDPELAKKRLKSLEDRINDFLLSLEALPDRRSSSPLIPERCNCMSLPFELVGKSKSKEEYLNDLQQVIDYIYAGDIYQANLSQRFHMKYEGNSWDLYKQLHEKNTAPFAAFLPYRDFQILSSSPERFIKITPDGAIQTRPIKGTRPRGKDPEHDERMAAELYHSQKDRAELTMIVDLERNDLGRICEFGSVVTRELHALEKHPTVWHLVAAIEGRLKKGLKPSELLKAIFPGGSITGAPKIRAMEIIDELEPYKRGIYTGSIGYIGFDGSWDLNIVIRTILLKAGTAYVHAGGGIVADSMPEQEYEETIHKAGRLLEVLGVILPPGPAPLNTAQRVEGNCCIKQYSSRKISLFETMRIMAEGIELPLYHWQRMKKGGELLGVRIPDFPEWMEKILHAIKSSQTNNLLSHSYALRISVSNRLNINSSDTLEYNKGFETLQTPEWSVTMRPIPYTLDQYEQGVSVLLLPNRRSDQYPLNYIKSPELLDTVSALRDVQAQGAFEGIWLNAEGEVMEGTRSNIFFVKKGAIHTPTLQSGCLSGTRRRIIKELAHQLQIPFYEGSYRPEDIYIAEEIFLTNAVMGIMPVTEIDGRKSSQEDNLVTRRLISHYREFISMNTIQYD